MGARFCIENRTNRPVVVQIEHISVRYCCWIEPGKRALWHPNRKGPQMHQGFYTLRVIDPSLNYKIPNMTVEAVKATLGGLLIAAGGAGLVSSIALMGFGLLIAGGIIGAGIVGVGVAGATAGAASMSCAAGEYSPGVRRGVYIGSGSKCVIQRNDNQFQILRVNYDAGEFQDDVRTADVITVEQFQQYLNKEITRRSTPVPPFNSSTISTADLFYMVGTEVLNNYNFWDKVVYQYHFYILFNCNECKMIYESGLPSMENIFKRQTFSMSETFIKFSKVKKDGIDVAFGPGLGKIEASDITHFSTCSKNQHNLFEPDEHSIKPPKIQVKFIVNNPSPKKYLLQFNGCTDNVLDEELVLHLKQERGTENQGLYLQPPDVRRHSINSSVIQSPISGMNAVDGPKNQGWYVQPTNVIVPLVRGASFPSIRNVDDEATSIVTARTSAAGPTPPMQTRSHGSHTSISVSNLSFYRSRESQLPGQLLQMDVRNLFNLRETFELIDTIASRWRIIGLKLKLPQYKLDAAQRATNCICPEDYLYNILSQFYRQPRDGEYHLSLQEFIKCVRKEDSNVADAIIDRIEADSRKYTVLKQNSRSIKQRSESLV